MVFVESAMSITYERMAGLKVDQDDGWFKSYQANIEDCYLTNLKKMEFTMISSLEFSEQLWFPYRVDKFVDCCQRTKKEYCLQSSITSIITKFLTLLWSTRTTLFLSYSFVYCYFYFSCCFFSKSQVAVMYF